MTPTRGNLERAQYIMAITLEGQMLTEEARLLQRLFDSLLDAVFILDAVMLRIVNCNSAASEIFGYSLDQLQGQPIAFLQVDEAAFEEFKRQLARFREQKGPRHIFTHRLKCRDGTIVPTEHSIAPIEDEQGTQIGWVCVVCDKTRLMELERQLRQSEGRHRRLMELWLDMIGVETARTSELQMALRRAEEVDQLKSQLLSTVSHELRTPLTSIRGQTSTLLDYADQITPEERAEALRIVDEEAARLDELIGHLLDMSRLESGTLRIESVATALRPIVIEAVELMATHAPGHRLVIDLPAALPLVQADPRRVMQILRNLIDNAIKFSPPGTTVTVQAEAQLKTVVVSVHDEGIGIPPEHLHRIFDRFYHVEDSKIRAAGVGLGLAICKGLVEAMSGHVTVISKVGKGSVFSFSLPRV